MTSKADVEDVIASLICAINYNDLIDILIGHRVPQVLNDPRGQITEPGALQNILKDIWGERRATRPDEPRAQIAEPAARKPRRKPKTTKTDPEWIPNRRHPKPKPKPPAAARAATTPVWSPGPALHAATPAKPAIHAATSAKPALHTATLAKPALHAPHAATTPVWLPGPAPHVATLAKPAPHTVTPATPARHAATLAKPALHAATPATPALHAATPAKPAPHAATPAQSAKPALPTHSPNNTRAVVDQYPAREHLRGGRYCCPKCGHEFASTSNFYRHMRAHVGEYPYTCLHCGRAFINLTYCKKHTASCKLRPML